MKAFKKPCFSGTATNFGEKRYVSGVETMTLGKEGDGLKPLAALLPLVIKPPKKRTLKDVEEEELAILKEVSKELSQGGCCDNKERDEYSHFGEMIASKIRGFDSKRKRDTCMLRVQQLLFDLEYENTE